MSDCLAGKGWGVRNKHCLSRIRTKRASEIALSCLQETCIPPSQGSHSVPSRPSFLRVHWSLGSWCRHLAVQYPLITLRARTEIRDAFCLETSFFGFLNTIDKEWRSTRKASGADLRPAARHPQVNWCVPGQCRGPTGRPASVDGGMMR